MKTAIVWKKSIYDNDFICTRCGLSLGDKDGMPVGDHLAVNRDDEKDNRLFCIHCRQLVGVTKEVSDDETGGEWTEDKRNKYGNVTERKCYAFGIGNLTLNPLLMGKQKKILKKIMGLKGFWGVNPQYPNGTVVIFDTLNNAKGGRNTIRSWDIQTSTGEIVEVFVDEAFLKGR